MLRLFNPDAPRASENFYRNVFALAAFITFACAVITNSPFAFLATLIFGALSRTAVQKNWGNQAFTERIPWIAARRQKPLKIDEQK
jgi:hypothetical protein